MRLVALKSEKLKIILKAKIIDILQIRISSD